MEWGDGVKRVAPSHALPAGDRTYHCARHVPCRGESKRPPAQRQATSSVRDPHSGVQYDSTTAMSLAPNEIFEDSYRILSQLGEGGSATVYLAQSLRDGRRVAIKVLHEFGSAERLQREAMILVELTHPRIVKIHEHGLNARKQPFFISEYVEGSTLQRTIATSGAVDWETAVRWCRQILNGLAVAHARGIVHRDLKPSNIMITPAGDAKILDFGVAMLQRGVRDVTRELTKTGELLGTPRYMAPELVDGADRALPASDLFGVGAMAYELLTGEPANDRGHIVSIIARHLDSMPYVLPTSITIPNGVRRWVGQMLAKDPAARPLDAKEALRVLDELLYAEEDETTRFTMPATQPLDEETSPNAHTQTTKQATTKPLDDPEASDQTVETRISASHPSVARAPVDYPVDYPGVDPERLAAELQRMRQLIADDPAVHRHFDLDGNGLIDKDEWARIRELVATRIRRETEEARVSEAMRAVHGEGVVNQSVSDIELAFDPRQASPDQSLADQIYSDDIKQLVEPARITASAIADYRELVLEQVIHDREFLIRGPDASVLGRIVRFGDSFHFGAEDELNRSAAQILERTIKGETGVEVLDQDHRLAARITWSDGILRRKYCIRDMRRKLSFWVIRPVLRPWTMQMINAQGEPLGVLERSWSGLGFEMAQGPLFHIRADPDRTISRETMWGLIATAVLIETTDP